MKRMEQDVAVARMAERVHFGGAGTTMLTVARRWWTIAVEMGRASRRSSRRVGVLLRRRRRFLRPVVPGPSSWAGHHRLCPARPSTGRPRVATEPRQSKSVQKRTRVWGDPIVALRALGPLACRRSLDSASTNEGVKLTLYRSNLSSSILWEVSLRIRWY